MRLLFIHQNLPGQYRHLLAHYASRNDTEVVGIGEDRRLAENFRAPIPGIRMIGYRMPQEQEPSVDHGLRVTEQAVRRGRAVLDVLLRLKREGYSPDVVYAHPGWGETLFLKDVFPRAHLIHYCEFYYQANGQDFGFDPEFPASPEDMLRLRPRNMHHLLALEQADRGIAPTYWQRARFPADLRSKIEVVHDGVDTDAVAPDPRAFIRFPHLGLELRKGDEVITFVSRNLEPYRGFHTFMRALPLILKERPRARVIIVGGDDVSYGKRLAKGTYRQRYLAEISDRADLSRVHFVGKVSYDVFLRILQISSAHIYLTYPFVLSWSLMEAMALGCAVVGSRTAPVEEVITHGDNGILVDFFSPIEVGSAVMSILDDPHRMADMRARARKKIVEEYDLQRVCLPIQRKLIETASLAPSPAVRHGRLAAASAA